MVSFSDGSSCPMASWDRKVFTCLIFTEALCHLGRFISYDIHIFDYCVVQLQMIYKVVFTVNGALGGTF